MKYYLFNSLCVIINKYKLKLLGERKHICAGNQINEIQKQFNEDNPIYDDKLELLTKYQNKWNFYRC